MSLAYAFRLSFYLSLAMSCVCLFYGEWDFLPWMTALLPVVLGTMFLAYRREGYAYISELTANRLGTCIGLGTVLWIAFKAPRSDQDLIAGGVPWPAMLVPLLAPLLPILLLVKLFRPKKARDFWIFQLIGLIIVTLSCILAGEVTFFLLLTIYLVLQLWCMGLFFLYRNLILSKVPIPVGGYRPGSADGVPLFGAWQEQDPMPIPRKSLRPERIMGWSMVILVVGLGFFLLLPRFTDSPWVPAKLSAPGRTVIKAGIDPGMGMDLYREGTIVLSNEPAFEVEARDFRGLPASIPTTQHWRLLVLDIYERGRWLNWNTSSHYNQGRLRPLPNEKHLEENGTFPDKAPAGMGETEVFLKYQVQQSAAGGFPLADPIGHPDKVCLFPQVNGVPVRLAPLRLIEDHDNIISYAKAVQSYADKTIIYGQIYTPKFQDKEVPPLGQRHQQSYAKGLLGQEVPGAIQVWTNGLLRKLPELDPTDYETDGQGHITPSRHAKIAKALTRHLAESGEFTYSLRLHRLGVTMDPTAEFLLKVKEGHCERYAAGLTLMLRALHIPARVVKGYSGCHPLHKGRYLIRQNQAHSWVEALVPGREAGTYFWLQLDPTPSISPNSDSLAPFFRWAWTRITNPDFTWKSLVMDYNTDRQTEVGDQFKSVWQSVSAASARRSTWETVWSVVRWPALGIFVLITIGLIYWGRRLWHRASVRSLPRGPSLSFQTRLLKVLDRYCRLRPALGQTPLEFAHVAQAELTQRLPHASAGSLPELPVRAVQVLYQHVFGGRPQELEISQALDTEISRLERILRGMVPA